MLCVPFRRQHLSHRDVEQVVAHHPHLLPQEDETRRIGRDCRVSAVFPLPLFGIAGCNMSADVWVSDKALHLSIVPL